MAPLTGAFVVAEELCIETDDLLEKWPPHQRCCFTTPYYSLS